MVTPRIKTAGPIARLFLGCRFAGIVSPWRTIYVLERYKDHPALIRHEVAHLGQMDRDGWARFWVLILWYYFVSPGYARSPYEIEARQAEANPQHPLLAGYALPC
jgi:hypothetical protein